jgi:uncharacterized protein with HEPN domain
MEREIEKLLIDILKAISEIKMFIKGKEFTDFVNDRGLQLIAEREFEIIGEAMSRMIRINPGIDEMIPDIHKIIGLRNILAHGYDIIEYEILWDIIENKIKPLEENINKIRQL